MHSLNIVILQVTDHITRILLERDAVGRTPAWEYKADGRLMY